MVNYSDAKVIYILASNVIQPLPHSERTTVKSWKYIISALIYRSHHLERSRKQKTSH